MSDPNRSGDHYALTVVLPVASGSGDDGRSHRSSLRRDLRRLPGGEDSPFAAVAATYFVRFTVLDDPPRRFPRSATATATSLVFAVDLHGDPVGFLDGLWSVMGDDDALESVFARCDGFGEVADAASFRAWIDGHRVDNVLVFNGSNDRPPAEQLKGLFLRQELARFAAESQSVDDPAELQRRFVEFLDRVRPHDCRAPTWPAGIGGGRAGDGS